MTTWHDQITELLATVRRTITETPGYRLQVAIAANDLEAAWADEPTSWGWRIPCQDYGKANASTHDRLAYGASCTEWEMRVSGALNALTDELLLAGSDGLAEYAAAMNDRVLTSGEQAAAIEPTWGDAWQELPPWARWMIGLVAAREFLGIWGDVRR
jgi:hypothetical protein